jgi:ABC-type lipoprotein export system ATPase subunit
MIKRLIVRKLNGRSDFDLCFNEDMNILTGKNGCGKTTLLKLAWYMVSGNFDCILAEIDFEYAEIITDSFALSISIDKSDEAEPKATWKLIDSDGNTEQFPSEKADEAWHNLLQRSLQIPSLFSVAQQQNNHLKQKITSSPAGSVFFPTFRRIEGGFSMSKASKWRGSDNAYVSPTTKVEDAMSELSERLSEGKHKFVASISTSDLEEMLTRQYNRVSQRINRENSTNFKKITGMINGHSPVQNRESDVEELNHLAGVLTEIQSLVAQSSNLQDMMLQPYTALGQLIAQIFHYNGIKIASGVTLGDSDDAIPADVLSAGEKQMLSFVAYNAFTRNSVIFIDEPEISLHVDWQRTLFSLLEAQGTNNQFIVATHSPFIYAKYADKELMLDKDRGE